MAGVTYLPFLNMSLASAGPQCCQSWPRGTEPSMVTTQKEDDSQVFNQPGTWELKGTRSHLGLCQDPF